MAGEKQKIDGYAVLHTIRIGGAKEIVAENAAAEYSSRYRLYQGRSDNPFGIEEYRVVFESGDYLEALREFTRRINVSLDGLSLDRVYRGSPLADYALAGEDCVPGGMETDLKGKVAAVKAEVLSPEYRAQSHQLTLVTGGFGCSPASRGQAVFGTNLYSGEQDRWQRSDILGVIAEDALPNWAREKLSKLREPREKESVLEKIREAKAAPKSPYKQKTPGKARGKEL